MAVDESFVFWSTSTCKWDPRGVRFKVPLHPTVTKRQLAEAYTDLGERLSYLVRAEIEDLEVVAGTRETGVGYIEFVTPGHSLVSVPPDQLRASVDEALRNAAARVADQVAFEESEGAEWLKQLRGGA